MNFPVKNSNRTMNLMTKTVAKTLPAIGATDGQGENAIARVKFFMGSFTWFATEMDPETGEMYGKVFSGHWPEGEFGYFSLMELATKKGCFGEGVERDRYFKPTALKNCHNPLDSR